MAKERSAVENLIDVAGGAFLGIQNLTTRGQPRQLAIAEKQLKNEQTRLANALSQLKVIALTDPNNKTANAAAIETFKRAGLPVQEGADFSQFLDKFRAQGQIAPKRQEVLARPRPGAGVTVKTPTRGGETITRKGAEPDALLSQGKIFIDPETGLQGTISTDAQGNQVFAPIQTATGTLEATQKQLLGTVPGEAITTGARTKIEKDVIDLQGTLTELEAIDVQFDENFFTFRGKVGAAATAFFEKLEIPVGKEQQDFLSKKTTFFADSKRVFLKFRKFITGVAGGIEEFREIAKATIDPEKDSSTQFKAKMESMRDNAKRTMNVLIAIRNTGLDPDNVNIVKQVFRGRSLSSVPVSVPQDVTLDTLELPEGTVETPQRTEESQAASDEEILRILRGQ